MRQALNESASNANGAGIKVGVLSDSFNDLGGYASDQANGALPSVQVLADLSSGGTDEGRAMLQIVHDMAPKARLGFATANGGQLNFANNIRSLAGLPGAPHAVSGFKADVIVDDIIYLDEPMFQDGIIAQAVDEVVAKGVSYFSSGVIPSPPYTMRPLSVFFMSLGLILPFSRLRYSNRPWGL